MMQCVVCQKFLRTTPEVPLDTTIPLPTKTHLCSLNFLSALVPSQARRGGPSFATLPTGLSYLDSELPLGEVRLALLGLLQDPGGVLGGQAATDGAGLLGPEVKRQVLLVLVEEAELGTLLRVDDSQDTGDRLADIVASRQKICVSAIARLYSPSIRPSSS